MTFAKGQSGNPGGRPKDVADIKELARVRTPEAIGRLVYWMQSDNARASVAACIALLDRGYGKPQASMSVETPGMGSLADFLASIGRKPSNNE